MKFAGISARRMPTRCRVLPRNLSHPSVLRNYVPSSIWTGRAIRCWVRFGNRAGERRAMMQWLGDMRGPVLTWVWISSKNAKSPPCTKKTARSAALKPPKARLNVTSWGSWLQGILGFLQIWRGSVYPSNLWRFRPWCQNRSNPAWMWWSWPIRSMVT